MKKLIDLYEMAWLNDAALSASEKQSLCEARCALRLFEKAMQDVARELYTIQAAA